MHWSKRRRNENARLLLKVFPRLSAKNCVVLLRHDPLGESHTWERQDNVHILRGWQSSRIEVQQIGDRYGVVYFDDDQHQCLGANLTFEYAFAAADERMGHEPQPAVQASSSAAGARCTWPAARGRARRWCPRSTANSRASAGCTSHAWPIVLARRNALATRLAACSTAG